MTKAWQQQVTIASLLLAFSLILSVQWECLLIPILTHLMIHRTRPCATGPLDNQISISPVFWCQTILFLCILNFLAVHE